MKDIQLNPTNLDEAVETIVEYWGDTIIDAAKSNDEDGFLALTHHGAGQFLRNAWYLWWYKDHNADSWPKEKPEIVWYFNSIGIYHPDDMSGIILISAYRRINDLEINLDQQVKYYQNYWKSQGYKDGKPKMGK